MHSPKTLYRTLLIGFSLLLSLAFNAFCVDPVSFRSDKSNQEQSTLLPPVFSVESGFYTNSFHLILSTPEPDALIYYTLDGSEPDPSNLYGITYQYKNNWPQNPGTPFGNFMTGSYHSLLYTGPVAIYNRSGEADSLSRRSSSYDNNSYYFPSSPVYKGTVVRAMAVKEGFISSPVVTHTYFLHPDGRQRFSLPVISIATNEKFLFDYNLGIYTPGVDFDNWRQSNPNSSSNGGSPANYKRRTDEWEHPANFSFFDTHSATANLSQEIGFRMHGGWSRAFPMKSFRIYARNEYGESRLNYPFFPDQNYDSYKRIILRNSGNDWQYSMFRDALMQKVVEGLNFETMAYRPAILFINGEYWGVHNIRERYDKHYLNRVFGVDEESIDYLTFNANVVEGENTHYLETLQYIQNNSMQFPANFDYVKTRIDTESFIDYEIANIYVANTDWPGNNIDFWRKRTETYLPNSPYGHDGRWRWLAYDMDFGYGLYGRSPNDNTLAFATQAGNWDWPNPDWSTFLLRNLLLNLSFKRDFINRFADLLNTAFLPERINPIIDEFEQNIESEMPEHILRWKTPYSMGSWNSNINVIRNFVNQRPAYQRQHIQQKFNLTGTRLVTLNVSDPDHGYIRINTIDIKSGTPGIPDNPYPWTGTYYAGIPVRLTAIGKEGYTFSHWEGISESTVEFYRDPDLLANITAHFKVKESEEPEKRQLIHYWYFNTSLPNDQPLQSIQPHFTSTGNTSLEFHSALTGYPFNNTSDFWRKASMERRNAPTAVNYRPEGNSNAPYSESEMRGIQIKQPFSGDGGENAMIFHLPSTGFTDLLFRFVAKDEWAVNQIIAEYSVTGENPQWTNANLANSVLNIGKEFDLYTLDFSGISETQNNSGFIIRLRFTCDNPNADDGLRITFNNFSLEGNQYVVSVTEENSYTKLAVYPNPAFSNATIYLRGYMDITIFNSLGKSIDHRKHTDRIELHGLAPGIYYLRNHEGMTTKLIIIQ